MDTATKQSIELAVTGILRASDVDSVTERQVRAMAATKLGLDLSDLPSKILVREIIESFLLSSAPSPPADNQPDTISIAASAAAYVANSATDLNALTLRQALDMVRLKVGLDVLALPEHDVVCLIIKSFVQSTAPEEVEMERTIEAVAAEVVKSCDVTMREVLDMVRDSFCKSVDNGNEQTGNNVGEEEDRKPVIVPRPAKQSPIAGERTRIICKLSKNRDVAVRGSGDKAIVIIRDLCGKDGKQMPSGYKSIGLSNDQWSNFRKSIPAIEEAIQKAESRLRSELERKQAEDKNNISQHENRQNDGTPSRANLMQNGTHHGHRQTAIGKHANEASTMGSTPQRPIGLIRFDGKNYPQWVDHMESYLNHLKIAYVLSEPCPSVAGVINQELGQTLSAAQKWIDDDRICHQNILNSLCDNLFNHYSKKPSTARDLWEDLKLIYLNEEHGAKVFLVKKYIEFQIVEEKSIFEQVQELHHIADSLIALGMYVEEKFHVNVIISKLPPSWRPFSVKLMKEDYLPVWMLMNHLKAEEESRGKAGKKDETILPRPVVPMPQQNKRLGPQRIPMKKPGVPPTSNEPDRDRRVKFCTVCKKKGHLMEQCWFKKSGGKDTTSENGSIGSLNGVAGRNTDGTTE